MFLSSIVWIGGWIGDDESERKNEDDDSASEQKKENDEENGKQLSALESITVTMKPVLTVTWTIATKKIIMSSSTRYCTVVSSSERRVPELVSIVDTAEPDLREIHQQHSNQQGLGVQFGSIRLGSCECSWARTFVRRISRTQHVLQYLVVCEQQTSALELLHTAADGVHSARTQDRQVVCVDHSNSVVDSPHGHSFPSRSHEEKQRTGQKKPEQKWSHNFKQRNGVADDGDEASDMIAI